MRAPGRARTHGRLPCAAPGFPWLWRMGSTKAVNTITSSDYNPEAAAGPVPAGRALIDLNAVSLRFRKYGDSCPTLRQTVINTIFRRSYARVRDFWIFRDLAVQFRHGDRVGLIGA